LQKQAGHLPAPLAKLAQGGLDTQEAAGGDPGQLSSAWYSADPAGHRNRLLLDPLKGRHRPPA